MPELFVITGPNGAGKSTHALSLLPETADLPVFDGDKLYYQLLDKYYKEIKVSKYAREKAGEELELIFNQQVNQAIETGSDYAYEGHFSHESSWSVIDRFKSNGYKINLVYFALEDVKLSEERVSDRVLLGGHHVPTIAIHNNFFGNIRMIDQHLNLIDHLKIIDNSYNSANHILSIKAGKITHFAEGELPVWMANMPRLLRLLK